MADDVLGQWQPQRMEHDWPVDRVEAHDFLADHVDIRRPVLLEVGVVIRAVA